MIEHYQLAEGDPIYQVFPRTILQRMKTFDVQRLINEEMAGRAKLIQAAKAGNEYAKEVLRTKYKIRRLVLGGKEIL